MPKRLDQLLNPVCIWRTVVVREAEKRTARGACTRIACGRRASAHPPNQSRTAMAADDGRDLGRRPRSVVDNENLESFGQRLSIESVQTPGQG